MVLFTMIVGSNAHADGGTVNNYNCQPANQCGCQMAQQPRKTRVVVKTVTKVVEKVVEKPVVVEHTVVQYHEVQVPVYTKNSVSLIGGADPTRLTTTYSAGNPATLDARTVYQADVGLMYQRDISQDYRLSGMVTVRGAALVGIGYNW